MLSIRQRIMRLQSEYKPDRIMQMANFMARAALVLAVIGFVCVGIKILIHYAKN